MMKLYHGTRLDVKERILENGIEPNVAENPNSIICEEGIFAFNNLDDAIRYARDLCESRGIAVFSFEIDDDECILDPEYDDGNAYFVETEDTIEDVTLEYEHRY